MQSHVTCVFFWLVSSVRVKTYYSKTPIYRGIWGKGNPRQIGVRGKSFYLLVFTFKSLKREKEIEHGKSGFAVNMGLGMNNMTKINRTLQLHKDRVITRVLELDNSPLNMEMKYI